MDENKINELFKELDDAIINNRNTHVPKLFSQLESTIGERSNPFSHQLHSTKISYFKATGNMNELENEENGIKKSLSNRERQLSNLSTQLRQLGSCGRNIQLDASIKSDIQKCLQKIILISCNDKQKSFYAELNSEITEFINSSLNSLNEYIKQDLQISIIKVSLNSLQIQIQECFEETVDHITKSLFLILTDLCYHLICLQYQLKVDFVNFVLSNTSKLRSILFANIPLSEEYIRLRANKLFVLFHPDRCESQQQTMFAEMFQLIGDDLEKQSKELTNNCMNRVNLVEEYKVAGKEQWDIALEYQCARRHVWTNVKRLNQEELKTLDDKKLENYQYYYAVSAYKYYRAAAIELEAAAGKEHIAEQVKLKKCMGLSLQLAEASLAFETQIYAIAGIYLFVTNDKECQCQNDFDELNHLLRQIRCTDARHSVASVNITKDERHESMLSKVITDFRHGCITLQQFQDALLSELRFTIMNTCLSPDEQESGLGIRSTNVPSGIGIGVSYLIGDLLYEQEFYNRKQSNMQDPNIRELLNNIIKDALYHYTKGQYSDFLYSLTRTYATRKVLLGIRQIPSNQNYKISLDVRPGVVVSQLLSYNFSPEGIANFLLLLGEVLLSAPQLKPKGDLPPNISLELPKYSDFIHCASKVFDEMLHNRHLTERANSFESKILPKFSFDKENHIEDLERTSSNHTYAVSSTYIKERLIVSTTVRLEEVRIVAKVNYAIAQLMIGGAENFKKSVNMIKEVKRELKRNLKQEKIVSVTKIRLQALTDIFAVFGDPDNKLAARNDLVLLCQKISRVASDIHIKNIDKVLTNNQIVSHCEPVTLSDDEIDEFILLDNILSGILKLDKTKFVDNVCNNYNRNVEPLTSWIKEIIRKKQFFSVYEWKRSFLKQNYSLTFEYLPFLSLLYNLIVIPCIVEYHPDHNHVFVPIKEVFDLSNGSAKASVYVVTEQTSDFEHIRPIKAIFVTSEVSLNYIYNQLEVTTDQNTKAYLKNQIALYHRRQAEKIDKTHHLDALKGWNHAKNFYNDSLKLNHNNLTAILGYATCLIMLCKYKLAEKVLNENVENRTQFRESSERWFLLGVLKRKLHDYDEAKNAVENALRLKKNYVEANNELAFIEKLQQETVAKRMKIYKKLSLNHVEPNSQQYNILSIDGGGIRGLIPAVWLSELERRTQLSSSSMFHMMAGTSTGAIVAAGLSLPDTSDERRSRYKAVDIVELYTNHSNRVFSRASMMQHLFGLWPTYTAEGRHTVFNQYFGDTRLSQTLTDLIVTTVNSGGNTTELFRRSESLTDPSKDYKLADVLMCTTAAPTYFPPYKLNGSVFIDGGVQANNPAMIAYADACGKTANRENIFVLSLGTGDYVPDPLKPNAERSLLFWMANNTDVLKVIFDGPQNNIDQQLSNILDSDTYHRWQVWLENPIVLDDIKKETLDKLMELAHIHFEEMDAFDSNNRLGKLIERLKGQ